MLGRWLPAPRRPVRATREYHFARQLAGKHQVALAFVSDNPDSAGSISALRSEFGELEFAMVPRTWKSLASAVRLAAGDSCTLSYFRSEALRTRLAERFRRARPDLVIVSASSMIQYALELDAMVPMVMDFGDLESEWWARQARRTRFPAARFFRTEATRLRIAEQKAAARAIGWVVASPEAAELVTSFAPGAAPVVIANGVETSSLRVHTEGGGAATIVLNTACVGEDDAQEIIAFQRDVLPRVRQKCPKARVLLVSREAMDSGEWQKAIPGTEIIAPVGDVRAALGRATLAIALLSTGVNDHASVFEPMAAGLPVVAGVKTASRVKAAAGRDLLVADGAEEFARKVTMLLAQPSLRAEVGKSGQAYVSLHHTWSAASAALGGLVQALEGDLKPSQPATDEPVFEVRP